MDRDQRHQHVFGGSGNGPREDCPRCQRAEKIASDAKRAREAATASPDDPAAKVDVFIVPRVDTMRSRYITPMADGSRITDAESFHVDIIADVLIHAAITLDRDPDLVDEDEMLTAIMDLAYRHARDELREYHAAKG